MSRREFIEAGGLACGAVEQVRAGDQRRDSENALGLTLPLSLLAVADEMIE